MSINNNVFTKNRTRVGWIQKYKKEKNLKIEITTIQIQIHDMTHTHLQELG